MKVERAKRGRPREFEIAAMLPKAFELFLVRGYAGTSVDALVTTMEINKPSFYAAFGTKRKLFQLVLDERIATLGRRFGDAAKEGETLEDALRELFYEAVEVYVDEQPGCVVVCAAVQEAAVDAPLATFTRDFFDRCDRGLAAILAPFVPDGAPVSASTLGRIADALVHDIALRARVGETKAKLRAFARDSASALARTVER